MRDDERGYTITRTFDAPRELVWAAWTKPEHFAVWFGTDAAEMRDVELDVRPGGAWRGTMILPDGGRIDWSGFFREVVEPERLVMDLTDGTEGTAPEDAHERFTVTFTALGDATEMTLRQTGGHLTDEQYEQTRIGTNSFLDTMQELLRREVLKSRHEAPE
jgi:uncharacterized protein YndB with AHSA1/START domain